MSRACAAIQRGQISGFLSKASSTSLYCVSEQQSLWTGSHLPLLFAYVISAIFTCSFEPSHEIMALFVLRKLILQTRMRIHSVGLDV